MPRQFLKQRVAVIGYTLLILVYFFLLANTETVAKGVLRGMNLAITAVVPSLFFFYILSEPLLSAFLRLQRGKSTWFSHLFHLPEIGSAAFLVGAMSGFPIGAKTVARLYTEGKIKRDDAQRLVVISNNTGPAFLIGGVGVGLLGDLRIGILLYLSEILAAVLFGILSGLGRPLPTPSKSEPQRPQKPFSLVESVGAAGGAMLSVGAFIVFFQAVIAVIDLCFDTPAITLFASLFLEIGNAAATVVPYYPVLGGIGIGLLAFSVAFGGLSVHMQSSYVWKTTGLPYFRYALPAKLFQGLMAGLIAVLIYPLWC